MDCDFGAYIGEIWKGGAYQARGLGSGCVIRGETATHWHVEKVLYAYINISFTGQQMETKIRYCVRSMIRDQVRLKECEGILEQQYDVNALQDRKNDYISKWY